MTWMNVQDEFELYHSVQACATAPELWDPTLEKIGKVFGGEACLLEVDAAGRLTDQFASGNSFGALVDFLGATKIESGVSPLTFLIHEAPLNYLFCKSNIALEYSNAAVAGRFSDLEKKIGLFTPVARPANRTVIMGILFDTLDPAETHRDRVRGSFGRLSRTVSGALAITSSLDQSETQNRILELQASTAHHCSAIVDRNMALVSATPSFRELLSQSDLFSLKGDVLAATDLKLENALNAMTFGPALGTADKRTRNKPPSEAEDVLFISGGGNTFTRVALRLVRNTARRKTGIPGPFLQIEIWRNRDLSRKVVDVLREIYALSEREAELAYLLAATGSGPETADQLGITRNTVKTHLRRIFDKTGTQSQLEVSNLLYRLSQLYS